MNWEKVGTLGRSSGSNRRPTPRSVPLMSINLSPALIQYDQVEVAQLV